MRLPFFTAVLLSLLALALWGAFGYVAYTVSSEREEFATLLSEAEMKESRERAVTRLRGSVRDTKDARETLESLVAVDVIQAVSTIEAVGEATRTRVKIDGATPGSSNEHVRTIAVSVTLEGPLSALLRAVTMLETLPFPAVVDSIDFVADRSQKDAWTARVRVRFITTSAVGV
jgi:hypothetical protein